MHSLLPVSAFPAAGRASQAPPLRTYLHIQRALRVLHCSGICVEVRHSDT